MEPGDKIGRYLLERRLGEGAMSEVFVAKHPQLEPRVAIKILRREVSADKQYSARFLEDARLAASLNHPNIVRVTDFDTADGRSFIVMDLVDGDSLDQWLKDKGRIEIHEAARIARDIALGLGTAHASKIVHRDVKPNNVLIETRSGAAKLTDFGAAKQDRPDEQALTAHGQTIGTPRYMAPEQVHGEPADPRTDLWALGATLFEMLAGQPAFSANSLPRLYQAIIADDPPRLASLRPDVPPELAALVGRLLSKSRTARPSTADEVAKALLPFAQASPAATAITATPQPTATTGTAQGTAAMPQRSGPGRPALIGGGIAAALVAAGLIYWLLPAQEPPVAPSEPAATVTPAAPVEPAPSPEQQAAVTPAPEPPQSEPPAAPSEPAPPPPQEMAATPEAEPPAPPADAAPIVTPTAPAEPEPPPQQQAALEPEPAPPALDEAVLRTALADLPCTEVTPTVAEGGAVNLAGTVPDAELAAQARRAIEAVPGVASVTDALRMVPAPACLAAADLERAVAATPASAPTFTVNRPDGVYREGDFLVVSATMPTGPAEYLYVDLLTDAGSAIHMLPEPMTPANRLTAGQTVRLGVEEAEQADGVRYWQVAPPLGTGYLVVTASEKPLYAGMREIEEPLQSYVDVLLPALKDPASGVSAVAVERLEFKERGS